MTLNRKLMLATLGAASVLVPVSMTMPVSAAVHADATRPTALWSCASKAVVRPASFTITCADGYTLLTATHWTSWSSKSASGTTTFGMNFCDPYCAASKITYFPKSTVRLTAPVKTRHGELFSKLSVDYLRKGKRVHYSFSWSSDPSFKA